MTRFDWTIFIGFWTLMGLTLSQPVLRAQLQRKSAADWWLDLIGLCVQGGLVPLLQVGVFYQLLHWLVPQAEHCLSLPGWAGFWISAVLVDYGYYWNHRWLHARGWPLHRVHHSVTQLDVVGASRNSVYTSFFILYVWVHGAMLFCLESPTGYLAGVCLTAVLDLWRHSQLGPGADSWGYRLCSGWLMLPQDHAQHHARHPDGNFGANFKLWDRLHHTALPGSSQFPARLGLPLSLSFWQKLFYPF